MSDQPSVSSHLQIPLEENTHFPLADELEWLKKAGFRTDVVWRKDLFAVLVSW